MKKSQLKEAIKNEIRSVLSENMNLSEIQDQGLIDGINAITRDINMFGPPKLKSVAEIQTYVEAFGDGVEEEGRRISSNMKAAMRGGGDEESLSGLVGLKEILNPEVHKMVNNLIRKIAKMYGYEERNAVYAIKQVISDWEDEPGQVALPPLKEGVWSTGTVFQIQNFLRDIKKIKTHYYDIVGSDDVFNGLDQAEMAAKEMMMNAPENRSDITEDEEPTSAEVKKEKSIAAEKEAALKAQKALKDLKSKMKKKAKEYKEAEGDAKEKIKAELKKMTAEKKKLEKDT